MTGELGVSKDLKPLLRRCRREGWTVEPTGGGHLRWQPPSGQYIVTSLTGSRQGVRNAKRDITRALEGR
jgi:hypothetical protein